MANIFILMKEIILDHSYLCCRKNEGKKRLLIRWPDNMRQTQQPFYGHLPGLPGLA